MTNAEKYVNKEEQDKAFRIWCKEQNCDAEELSFCSECKYKWLNAKYEEPVYIAHTINGVRALKLQGKKCRLA